VQEFELRQEVVSNYIESTKKSQEDMRIKLEAATDALNELRKQDWSKQILDLKRENEFLREEIAQKAKDFTNLKGNIAMAIQTSGGPNNVQSHLTNLLENQSKENVRLSRLIQEYEKKDKLCTRKWNALLQENLQLQEKFNG
jgi:chromosome segregation ATPase